MRSGSPIIHLVHRRSPAWVLVLLLCSPPLWGLHIGAPELDSRFDEPLHLVVPIQFTEQDRQGALEAAVWFPDHPELEAIATLSARRRGADILLELTTPTALRLRALALRVDVWTDAQRKSRMSDLRFSPKPQSPSTEATQTAATPAPLPEASAMTSLERLRARQAAAAQSTEPTDTAQPAPNASAAAAAPLGPGSAATPQPTQAASAPRPWRHWQLAGLVIAGLGLGWLLYRRYGAQTVQVPPPEAETPTRTVILPSTPRLTEATVILPEPAAPTSGSSAGASTRDQADSGSTPDTDAANPGNWALDTLQVEDEAHLHEVYGEHEEAARILRTSIEQGETRASYLLRLLRNYALAGQRDAFVELAAALYRDRHDDPGIDWSVIQTLGSEIAPEEPMFHTNRLDFDLDQVNPNGPQSK